MLVFFSSSVRTETRSTIQLPSSICRTSSTFPDRLQGVSMAAGVRAAATGVGGNAGAGARRVVTAAAVAVSSGRACDRNVVVAAALAVYSAAASIKPAIIILATKVGV